MHAQFITDDHTRVRLRSKGGSNNDDANEKSEDYLNANFVDGFRQPRAYIATQGPIQSTFSAFWKMVWEQNTQVIVMITHLFENGKVKFVTGQDSSLEWVQRMHLHPSVSSNGCLSTLPKQDFP